MRDRFTLRSNSAEELRIALRHLYDYVDRRINGNTTDRGTQTDAVRQVVQPTASLEAVVTHTHTWDQIADKPQHNDISGRTEPDAHPIFAITGLQAALDDKSDDGHGHSISDIAYLQSELDSKVGIGSVRYDFIDTATGQGLYRVTSPVGVHDAGMLLVSQLDAYNYQSQVYFSGDSIFTRQGTTGSWGAWKEVSWSDHTHSGTYESVISAGTALQYWRGDKSWQTLNTAAVPESGNLYFTADRVRATALTGYSSGANTPLAATDSILAAFGKIQGQLDGKTGLTYIEADALDTAPTGLSMVLSPIGLHDDGAVITSRNDAYGYQAQLWMTGSDLQMRQRASGTWGAWVTFSKVGHTHGNADLTGLASASVSYAASAGNADTLDGFHASQLQEAMSQRDFPNGTLVQTSIPYGTNGSAFLLRITGNSYGAAVPFDTLVQGYIYNDTIINIGGIANGTHFSDLRAIRVGGNLAFWWPRMDYWQGFNVHVQDTLDNAANKVTSITDSALPTTDKMVQFGPSIRASIHSGNIGSQNVNSATYLQGHAPDENATGATIAKRLSGGGIRATDVFVDSGWVRLNAEGTGLYCPINGAYFYQSASGSQWISQSGNGFRLRNLAGADKGWLYFDNSGFGLLNSASGWSVRCSPGGGGGDLFGNWGVVGNLGFSSNYGHGIVGLYSSVRYQQVYAMGAAYTMAADGTALNDFYGIAWTHHNVGGQSISGLGHQALFCMGGVTWTAIGAGVWTRGDITAWGNVTAYASDKRLKENIEVIPDALEKVKALHGVTYQWNLEAQNYLCDDGRRHAGVLAQEVQAVLPEAVCPAPFDVDGATGQSRTGQNYLTVQNERLVALLIEAVKELSAKVDRLEAEAKR